MIARIWRGYTSLQNAESYETLLKNEVFIEIINKKIKGLRSIQLLRQTIGSEVEFLIIIYFEELAALVDFACSFYHEPVVPDKVKKLLTRYDTISRHYNAVALTDSLEMSKNGLETFI